MKILNEYIANPNTMAIFPAKQIDYDSIVWEGDEVLYVRKTPLQIIKDSCIEYWSTLEATRKAVAKNTGFRNKLPIPINIYKSVIAFPTEALTNHDCIWFFFNHILYYRGISKKETYIVFNHNKTYRINMTEYAFHSLVLRSFNVFCELRNQKRLFDELCAEEPIGPFYTPPEKETEHKMESEPKPHQHISELTPQ